MGRKNVHSFYVKRITVTGRGRFPVDMLRYDVCVPASSFDAGKIAAKVEGSDREPRDISLVQFAGTNRGPTVRRWESFGWKVKFIEKVDTIIS